MNTNKTITAYILSVIFITAFGVTAALAQSDRDFAFVVIETTVTRKGIETSDANPEERRFYISNIVEIPLVGGYDFRNANKSADAYFTKGVVEPMEAKGILHKYYDENVVIDGNQSYVMESREKTEAARSEILANLLEQNANTFSFVWNYNTVPDGLATTKPALMKHGAEQPLYGVATPGPAATPPAPAPKRKHS